MIKNSKADRHRWNYSCSLSGRVHSRKDYTSCGSAALWYILYFMKENHRIVRHLSSTKDTAILKFLHHLWICRSIQSRIFRPISKPCWSLFRISKISPQDVILSQETSPYSDPQPHSVDILLRGKCVCFVKSGQRVSRSCWDSAAKRTSQKMFRMRSKIVFILPLVGRRTITYHATALIQWIWIEPN